MLFVLVLEAWGSFPSFSTWAAYRRRKTRSSGMWMEADSEHQPQSFSVIMKEELRRELRVCSPPSFLIPSDWTCPTVLVSQHRCEDGGHVSGVSIFKEYSSRRKSKIHGEINIVDMHRGTQYVKLDLWLKRWLSHYTRVNTPYYLLHPNLIFGMII